jgi:hypothetical protein
MCRQRRSAPQGKIARRRGSGRVQHRSPVEIIFRVPSRLGGKPNVSNMRGYSTISFLRLWTNATTSRCSASGTWNFAKVAAACPRNTFQSLSLMRMPRSAEQHVPAAIVRRSAGARAEEVDQELLLAHHAVFPAMCPKAAKLRGPPGAGATDHSPPL